MYNIKTYSRWLNSEWYVYGDITSSNKESNLIVINNIRPSLMYRLGKFESNRGKITLSYDETLEILKQTPPEDQKLMNALMCWVNDVDLEYRNVTA